MYLELVRNMFSLELAENRALEAEHWGVLVFAEFVAGKYSNLEHRILSHQGVLYFYPIYSVRQCLLLL